MKTMKTVSCLVIFVIGMTLTILGMSGSTEASYIALTDAQMARVVGAGQCVDLPDCCYAEELIVYEPGEPEIGCAYIDDIELCTDATHYPACSEEYWCEECFLNYQQPYKVCENFEDDCIGGFEREECGMHNKQCVWETTGMYFVCNDHPIYYGPYPYYCMY